MMMKEHDLTVETAQRHLVHALALPYPAIVIGFFFCSPAARRVRGSDCAGSAPRQPHFDIVFIKGAHSDRLWIEGVLPRRSSKQPLQRLPLLCVEFRVPLRHLAIKTG